MRLRQIRLVALSAGLALVVLTAFAAAVPSPRVARAQSTVVVSMANDQYAPGTLTIAAGTVVTWVNNEDPAGSDNIHDVIASDYTTFTSDYIAPGGTYSQEFDTPGAYSYLCDLHTNMQGTIVVQ